MMRLIAGIRYEIQISSCQLPMDKADAWSSRRENNIGGEESCQASAELFFISDEVPGCSARAKQALRDFLNSPAIGFRFNKTWCGSRQAARGNHDSAMPRILLYLLYVESGSRSIPGRISTGY